LHKGGGGTSLLIGLGNLRGLFGARAVGLDLHQLIQ
jgi:hypothetical protein